MRSPDVDAAPIKHRGQQVTPVEVSLSRNQERSLVLFAAAALADRRHSRSELRRTLDPLRPARSRTYVENQLAGQKDVPSAEFLKDLEKMLSIEGAQRGRLGSSIGLLAFAQEVLGERDDDVHVPAGWFTSLVGAGVPRTETEVLIRGAGLVALGDLARTADEREELLLAVSEEVQTTVTRLLDLAVFPERERRAHHLLARIGSPALSATEKYIWQSPLGFRAVRVLGRMLFLRRERADQYKTDPSVTERIENMLLRMADPERLPPDPYPARSFWVEALRYAPQSPPNGTWEWVPKYLEDRARDESRPVRERVYAAFVLFHRGHRTEDSTASALADATVSRIADGFEREGNRRQHREEGLLYGAATLRELVRNGSIIGGPEDRDEPAIVKAAVAKITEADVPVSVVGATRYLVCEALTTIDGTRRRRACDTLRTAGVASEAVKALDLVLRDKGSPRWLQEHAAFITGYLRVPQGIATLMAAAAEPRQEDAKGTVTHAALWGLGDLLRVAEPGAERTSARTVVIHKIKSPQENVRRAATYALAMLGDQEKKDKLEELARHRDSLTSGLAKIGVHVLHSKSAFPEDDKKVPSALP
jgi:hypothetical protein